MKIEKKCCICKKIKLINEFRKQADTIDGYAYICRECKKKKESIWRNKNRLEIRKRQREYYNKNRDLILKKRSENYDPIKSKARFLARKIELQKCIFCDKQGERHHKDYKHPLDIVFLCKSHHKQVHDGTIKI